MFYHVLFISNIYCIRFCISKYIFFFKTCLINRETSPNKIIIYFWYIKQNLGHFPKNILQITGLFALPDNSNSMRLFWQTFHKPIHIERLYVTIYFKQSECVRQLSPINVSNKTDLSGPYIIIWIACNWKGNWPNSDTTLLRRQTLFCASR